MAISPQPRQAQRPTDYQVFAARYPEVIERIALLRQRRDSRMAKLGGMARRQQHGEARKLLRSGSLHFLYAFEAMRAKRMLGDATPDTITELATRCNPFAPVSEPFVVRLVRKAGKPRQVHDFGPLKRMHQLLVADMLRALHPPRQDQFLFNGGMPKALKAIEDAFRRGDTFAAEVDVVSFYDRVRHDGLAKLLQPLPSAVTEHVVWDSHSRRWIDDDGETVVSSAHTGASSSGSVGLSLGSSTSPVVGEIIIGRLLRDARPETVVAYADNILVLGRGEDDVGQRVANLREVAARSTSGPLELRAKPPANFCDEAGYVSFAGQWGRAIRHRLDWQPDGNKQRQHLVTEESTVLSADAIAAAESKLVHWRRAYGMWKTGDVFVTRQLAALAAVRYYQNAQPEHFADAQQRLAIAYLAQRGIELADLLPEGSTKRHRQRRMELMDRTQDLLDLFGRTRAAAA